MQVGTSCDVSEKNGIAKTISGCNSVKSPTYPYTSLSLFSAVGYLPFTWTGRKSCIPFRSAFEAIKSKPRSLRGKYTFQPASAKRPATYSSAKKSETFIELFRKKLELCYRLARLQIPRIDDHGLTDIDARLDFDPVRASSTGRYGFLQRFSIFNENHLFNSGERHYGAGRHSRCCRCLIG